MTPEEAKKEILDMGVPEHTLEIEQGWYVLVAGLFREMKRINPEWDGSKVGQVKQKFAGLRVYFDCSLTPEEDALVNLAEYEARNTCETCGQPGKKGSLNGYWMVVCCEVCSLKHNQK
jgi:hypothetical protein